MKLRPTYGLSTYVRGLKVLLTKKVPRVGGGTSQLPRKGDTLFTCCSGEAKRVESVDVWGSGEILYTDGSGESLYHCAWEYIWE